MQPARAMHNAFTGDGPKPGIEIARALGDLSHNVYTRADGVTNAPAAAPGELMFIDYWADPAGMETFFANPVAQQAADGLYCCREEMEWAIDPNDSRSACPLPTACRPATSS